MSKKVLFVFTIITMTVMSILDAPLKNEVTPNGVVSFELAGTLENSIAILNSWSASDKLYAGISLGFDYVFMLMYSLLLYKLVEVVTAKIKNDAIKKFGKTLAIFMLIAGILDAIENYALIKLFVGELNQTYSSIAFYSASTKFSIIAIGLVYLILAYSYTKINPEKKYD